MINFYVLGCLLIFIFLFYCFLINKNETFGNKNNKNNKSNKLTISFLNHHDAYQIIDKSGYFNHFNQINLKARNCANLFDCRQKYMKELLPIDPMEQEAIKWLLNKLIDRLAKFQSFMEKYHYKFAKFSSRLEANMPHTHNDVIFLPASFYQDVWKGWQHLTHKKEDINYNNSYDTNIDEILGTYGSTLIHELTHVLQRKYSRIFKKLYQKEWGFISINKMEIDRGDIIFDRSRTNPDGLDLGWIWSHNNNYYLLQATFRKDHPRFLTDVDNTAYTLEKKNTNNSYRVVGYKSIEDTKDFTDFFGFINNNYHPNEISADYMAKFILQQMGLKYHGINSLIENNSPAYRKFMTFMNNNETSLNLASWF